MGRTRNLVIFSGGQRFCLRPSIHRTKNAKPVSQHFNPGDRMITYANKEKRSLVVRSVHSRSVYSTALILTLVGASLALAQETNAPVTTKPVVVTGSLIPTAETVGAAPVQTIAETTIQQAGTGDALLTLKKLVPSFTGSGNYLGSVNNNVNIGAGFQAFTGQSYVQLRNLPTLVLIDGQRVVTTALTDRKSVV